MLPQPAKRATRRWAAWTREEEESFFSALRQVGKNFEKITCRIKSKNKDQVRHYYYRLVRKMNKLLGPRLCLNAKNSKETNAAMLRWWSLLEKYSCKASKLHLKPRRFKIFLEALENQLLKDRKKNVRKRSQGENSSPSPCPFSSQSRPSAHDNHTVKMVLMDSQIIQKLGPEKPSFKRGMSLGTNRGNNKGESMSAKQTRQRRKPGLISSSDYRKWEEAAIAGVSLVADAAEHLERNAADAAERIKNIVDAAKPVNCASAAEHHCNIVNSIGCDQIVSGQKGSDLDGGSHPPLLPLSMNHVGGGQLCNKLKLQLFPIDDATRRALEMDKHNPHLELTLSIRKKISSVLEHLNRKWGSSTAANGEIMLFPYGTQRENLMSCTRWTLDSICSAADVYAMIGSPPVFRLWSIFSL
ncbi:hypothetical protein SAY86_007289 [Trapa natans]|uniref:TSL-kinase interacting protein 1 n=1 Tax=Trapa natans TaxID=22666 RepID=A0AAN7R0B7_TRANT|nr:hypothetical protein SAY86_007289 [Trapa natans]